jgi:hypothetical protein
MLMQCCFSDWLHHHESMSVVSATEYALLWFAQHVLMREQWVESDGHWCLLPACIVTVTVPESGSHHHPIIHVASCWSFLTI